MKNKEITRDHLSHILIVEDSPTQAEQLKYTLEKFNYKVVATTNGIEALEHIKSNKPSLVISDIVMPKMDGYELCKKIKSMEGTMDIPVILLTSLSNSEDVLEGLACGADNFLTKPYNEEYLVSHIERIFASRKFGNIERVRVGVEIMLGGKKRFITADQQQMLTLLISTYEAAVQRNHELTEAQEELKTLNENLGEMVEERTVELKNEILFRKEAEIQIKKLNRVYAVLSNVNQTIVRVKDKQSLFDDICRIAIEDGKFRMAWIGFVDKTCNKFLPVAAEGHAREYIKTLNIDLNDKITGDGPIGRSIKTGKHYLANDIANDPEMIPWRENALKSGNKSSAAFPINLFGQTEGAIILYSEEKSFFDEAEVRLLDEMAADVSFALEFIEKEKQRKINEDLLKKSELKYKALFDNDLTGNFVADIQGNILLGNPALARILGFSKVDDLLKENITTFYRNPKDRVEFLNTLRREKKIEQLEREFILRDGSLISVIENVIGEFNKKGELIGLNGYLFENTKRKKAEQELIIAKEKAEESNNLKTAFLNNISHEIRTPLNGILGFAEFIVQPDITAEEKAFFLQTLNLSSQRLLKTITDYMDTSLIVSGNMEVHARPFEVDQMLTNIRNKFKNACQEKKLELIEQIPNPDKIILNTDHELLGKALFHLLDNAVKFTNKGSIEIGYTTAARKEPLGNTIEFYIKDTGIGIAEEALNRIFDCFSQENYSDIRGHEGSGLGLTIAKGIIELLDGKIRMESRKNKGTSVFVSLPIEKSGSAKKTKLAKSDHKPSGSPVILIAEDDNNNYVYIETVLKQYKDGIIRAHNGREAVELCKKNDQISLILMDIKMPLMNGLDATRAIKSFRKDLPIIAVTAYSQSGDEYNIKEAGCDDYISKPINRELLMKLLKKYMN